MEDTQVNSTTAEQDNTGTSIFDDLKPKPEFYSERAVYVLSVLFSVLFGSVLMAINFKNTEGKKGIPQVIVFGILFTAIELLVINMMAKGDTSLTFVFNFAGGWVLRQFFWNKYIGANVAYTKKSVLIPAIIGIIITGVFLLAIIYAPAKG